MAKLVIFEFLDGDFEQGFRVNVLVGQDGANPSIKLRGKLPPEPTIINQYKHWQTAYNQINFGSDGATKAGQNSNPNFRGLTGHNSRAPKCPQLANSLTQQLNNWLSSQNKDCEKIKKELQRYLSKTDEVWVIIQTDNLDLQRLPWHLWDVFSGNYPKTEFSVSLPEYQEVETRSLLPKDRVKILTVIGNSKELNVEADRQIIEDLPGAEINPIVEPNLADLTTKLGEESWDVIFFAGHSNTNGETGYLHINSTDTVTIADLEPAFKKAISDGLKLAIFNSCDGLGLARQLADLHIPQIIVMREPIPDKVAQDFLKHFLKAYSRGRSLYASMRQARQKLEENWKEKYPGASWLPVICQNPAELPMTWFELRQGFRSTSRRQQLRDDREAALLNAVKEHWVEGVLEKSLHGRLRMELDLEERLDAIAHPWGMVWETPEQLSQTLPPGTRVIDILDRMGTGGTLLILGEPGSGKTISLLELADDMIAHAEQDITLPIPVVFNLSSWKGGRQTFFDWLVQEFDEKYRVSKSLSKEWINKEKLLLLLDGLDEMKSDRQESCIEELNKFIQKYGKTEVVVCSRIEDYKRLSKRLKFRGAIKIQFLTDQQIEDYL